MYTTRPLAVYKSNPEALFSAPEGPNSGYLVLQDEESTPTCCFGICKIPFVRDLPFLQNKSLTVEFHVQNNQASYHSYDEVYLFPVVNQPLSANRYYMIKAGGKNHRGEAYASSKAEDMVALCFCFPQVQDVAPRPFDPNDIYQQFEFSTTNSCCFKKWKAKSMAPGGLPPEFLRRDGWGVRAKTPKHFTIGDANGLDSALRARLPDFSFPLSQQYSDAVVVGKWYCPFVFIIDGTEKDRAKKSVFYQMTLEQSWQCVFTTQNNSFGQAKNVINVDVVVTTEMVRVGGNEAVQVKNDGAGIVWFETIRGNTRGVGLSKLIVDRMEWEKERGGWVKGKEKQVRVVKEEKYEGMWTSYGCYALIERFVLRRNDGSLVLTYDFMHTHQLRGKWE